MGIHVDRLKDPEWHNASGTHDWRTYVPEDVRRVWHKIDTRAKACVYSVAQSVASRERE